ncbi:MAG: hypothetical protein GX442_17740 [Candidatus Riflebacteria bacterium]|nr:hypothetical protein [Candidatus Riflebacteria bacterium]
MMTTGRRGMAVVVVLFFAFTVGILLYALVGSSTNIAFQNKLTLRQLQAYYLAHSGIQHIQLKLRLLPRETFDAFAGGGGGNPYADVSSDDHPTLLVCPNGPFDLFSGNPPDDAEPIRGSYTCTTFELESTHKRMKLVQDGYKIRVVAEVFPNFPVSLKQKVEDEITEEIIVSRFTGGIGGP